MRDDQLWLDNFRLVLERLASPAVVQAQYLTGLGVAECLDELALEFDDVYQPLASVLISLAAGSEILLECEAIDAVFKSASIGWTFDDLDSDSWAGVRNLAARALSLLGLSIGGGAR